jgi:hypothetical protein
MVLPNNRFERDAAKSAVPLKRSVNRVIELISPTTESSQDCVEAFNRIVGCWVYNLLFRLSCMIARSGDIVK